MKIKWGELCTLPVNSYQTYNSHSTNDQAFYCPLPLLYLAHSLRILVPYTAFALFFNYLSPTPGAGMKWLYSPKLSQFWLCSFFTFSLRKLFHSLGINYHSYVIAASSYVFKCDLSLVHLPRFHDASISVCLKINSLYLAENCSNAHTIDN